MILFKNGNIFDSNTSAIVNPVNCIGVMGNGLALQFKKKYFNNFIAYKKACDLKQLDIGKLFIFKSDDKHIVNFPTKYDWKFKSKYEYIDSGLKTLKYSVQKLNFESISIPPLGCGLGGLESNIVKQKIIFYLDNINSEIQLYNFL